MPRSVISPSSMTKIWSAWITADNRWAMISIVAPWEISAKFSWITPSVIESSDDVASSNRKMRGFFKTTRAMATRCFSPPDNFRPRSPTTVS